MMLGRAERSQEELWRRPRLVFVVVVVVALGRVDWERGCGRRTLLPLLRTDVRVTQMDENERTLELSRMVFCAEHAAVRVIVSDAIIEAVDRPFGCGAERMLRSGLGRFFRVQRTDITAVFVPLACLLQLWLPFLHLQKSGLAREQGSCAVSNF